MRYDTATKKWFNSHHDAETTVMQCSDCGLYYKPILGHKCNKNKMVKYSNISACDFCSNDDDTYLLKQRGELSRKGDFYPGINMYIAGDELWADVAADTYEPYFTEASIKINYCPMCGRKLT